ncbi:SET and MYND domain-containing protein 4 [Discoglossus pictus]
MKPCDLTTDNSINIVLFQMEHPLQQWQDCADKHWVHLTASEREKFSTNASLEESFMTCWSKLQPEDEEVLDSLCSELSVEKQPCAVQFYKEGGNKSFGRRQYKAAAVLYSKAISHAGTGTEEMAVCFANRSAVLFYLGHYSACLEDIQHAQEHGYPDRLKDKILKRQEDCWQKLKQSCTSTSNTLNKEVTGLIHPTKAPNQDDLRHKCLELELDKNPQLTNTCSSLRLNFNTAKGRHLVAAQDIPQGEILIWEEAFVSVIIPERKSREVNNWDTSITSCDLHCHHCLRRVLASLPCQHCSYASYCSDTCRDSAWSSYHYVECPLGALLLVLGVFCHTALRAVLVAGCEEVTELIKQTNVTIKKIGGESCSVTGTCQQKYSSSYKSVFNLLPHAENHKDQWKFICGFSAAALCKRLSIALLGHAIEISPPSEKLLTNAMSTNIDWLSQQHYLGQAMLQHILQLHCNAQAVTVLQEEYEDRHSSVETSTLVRLATAVFPVLSLLNHSCDPNTSVSFQGRYAMVKANQPIKSGEEVVHCYGPHKLRMGVEERQRLLKAQYFFSCPCEACTKEQWSTDTTSCDFCCPKCSSPLKGDRDLKCTIKGCISNMNRDQLLGRLQHLKDMVDVANDRLQDNQTDVAIGMLKTSLLEAGKFLSVNHILLGEISDHLAQAEASKGNWITAAEYLKRSIQIVEHRFGSSSIELGHELFKLAQILFNGREVTDCMSTILRAQQLLSMHYGADHNLVQELQEMKTCLG